MFDIEGAVQTGAKAIPLNAVFVLAVAMVVTVPLIEALYPLASVIEYIDPVAVPYKVTVVPFTLPVRPLMPVADMVPVATHEPLTSEYF